MKSLAELQAIRDRAKMAVNVRENSEAKTRVLVGMATYVKMTPEKALRVVNDHIVNGNVVTEYTIGANQK